jgi:hypothetical protein
MLGLLSVVLCMGMTLWRNYLMTEYPDKIEEENISDNSSVKSSSSD